MTDAKVNVQEMRELVSEEWHQYDPAPVTAAQIRSLLDVAEAAHAFRRSGAPAGTTAYLARRDLDEALARLDFGGPQ